MEEEKIEVGIIGAGGIVGSAYYQLFRDADFPVLGNDPKLKDFSSPLATLTTKCPFILIAVPTPTLEDYQRIEILADVLRSLEALAYSGIVVIKSTVLPHSIDIIVKSFKLHILYSPEFLIESNAFGSLLTAPFHLIGQTNLDDAVDYATLLHRTAIQNKVFHYTQPKTAAMVKYIINTFLATKVTFMNIWYDIAKDEGIDWEELMRLFTEDPRIGDSHCQVPGPDGRRGFGGSCFPKDMAAIIWEYKSMFFKQIHSFNLRIRQDG